MCSNRYITYYRRNTLQCCVPVSILSVLTILGLSTSDSDQGEISVLKGPGGLLKTVNSRSVDRCTLLLLNCRHLSYVAEVA